MATSGYIPTGLWESSLDEVRLPLLDNLPKQGEEGLSAPAAPWRLQSEGACSAGTFADFLTGSPPLVLY